MEAWYPNAHPSLLYFSILHHATQYDEQSQSTKVIQEFATCVVQWFTVSYSDTILLYLYIFVINNMID